MQRPPQRDRGDRSTLAAIVSSLAAAVLALALLGCGRAEAQGAPPPLAGWTDCGLGGALVMLNTSVTYDPADHSSGERRWGICSGNSGRIVGCDDKSPRRSHYVHK